MSCPTLADGRTDTDNLVSKKRSVKTMTDGPYGGPYGIQNHADFGPAHGFGKWIGGNKDHDRTQANVLFGDGHVRVFKDRDGDGIFGINDEVEPRGARPQRSRRFRRRAEFRPPLERRV